MAIMCNNEGCGKECGLDAVLLNCDGDFACSPECAKEYERQRDNFLNNILPNDELFEAWLGFPLPKKS